MAGRDKQDAVTADADDHAEKDYTKFLDAAGLKEARLGVAMQFTTRPELKTFFQPFIDKMRDAGATLVDVTFTPDYSKVGSTGSMSCCMNSRPTSTNILRPAAPDTSRSKI